MQTLSSASRTCMASASAVECTATVAMPSSLHARNTRSAISPRLAIRTLSNMALGVRQAGKLKGCGVVLQVSFDDHQRLAEFDRLTVLDQDLHDRAAAWRRNLVHRLHRFDDEERVAARDAAANLDIGARARGGADIGGAHHG